MSALLFLPYFGSAIHVFDYNEAFLGYRVTGRDDILEKGDDSLLDDSTISQHAFDNVYIKSYDFKHFSYYILPTNFWVDGIAIKPF